MKPAVSGIEALKRYLNNEWSLDQLYDWALTYGDRAEDRSDKQSMSVAGHVLAWVWETSDEIRTREQLDAELASLARTPREAVTRSA